MSEQDTDRVLGYARSILPDVDARVWEVDLGKELEDAYKAYKAEFGCLPLTDLEKQQALLNHMLSGRRIPEQFRQKPEGAEWTVV